jgi:glycosyltransferase involved in cell wall biosynthesis
MNNLLSVVTINKNNADGLIRTVASLQTYRNDERFEFIFIDGLSNDNSLALAKDFYKDSEIICEPDSGIYYAMNKGLRKAKGDYVIWINSGDELVSDPSFVRYLAESKADIHAFAVEEYDQLGAFRKILTPSIGKMPNGMIQHQGMIFQRQTVLDIGGYDESFRITSDFDLLLRIYLLNGIIKCHSETSVSRFYLGGLSSTFRPVLVERINILRKNRQISLWKYYYQLLRAQFDRNN